LKTNAGPRTHKLFQALRAQAGFAANTYGRTFQPLLHFSAFMPEGMVLAVTPTLTWIAAPIDTDGERAAPVLARRGFPGAILKGPGLLFLETDQEGKISRYFYPMENGFALEEKNKTRLIRKLSLARRDKKQKTCPLCIWKEQEPESMSNHTRLLHAEKEVSDAIDQLVQSGRTGSGLQSFLRPKGPSAWIVRVVWRPGDKVYTWVINDTDPFVTNTSNPDACSIVKSTGLASWSQCKKGTADLVAALQERLQLRFTEFVADFVEAEDGHWWLIKVKAFRYEISKEGEPVQVPAEIDKKCPGAYCKEKKKEEKETPVNELPYKVIFLDRLFMHYLTKILNSENTSKDYSSNLKDDPAFEAFQKAEEDLKLALKQRDSTKLYNTAKVCSFCYQKYMEHQRVMQSVKQVREIEKPKVKKKTKQMTSQDFLQSGLEQSKVINSAQNGLDEYITDFRDQMDSCIKDETFAKKKVPKPSRMEKSPMNGKIQLPPLVQEEQLKEAVVDTQVKNVENEARLKIFEDFDQLMNNDIQWDKYLPKADHSTNPFDVLVGDLPSLAVNLTNPYDQTLPRAQNQGGKVLLSPVPDKQERALEEALMEEADRAPSQEQETAPQSAIEPGEKEPEDPLDRISIANVFSRNIQPCERNCGEAVPVEKMEYHLEEECPFRLVFCMKGCGAKMRAKNKPAHERQCTGFWPCQKLDLEFAVFWADDQYRMDTTAKLISGC